MSLLGTNHGSRLRSAHHESRFISMTAVYCHTCGRPNGAAAIKCMWCGVALSDDTETNTHVTTCVEILYVDGIDRFADAGPVRLMISAKGVEVVELMPGSRSIKIPVETILEANVIIATADEQREGSRSALRRRVFRRAGRQAVEQQCHYTLAIRFTVGSEVQTASFRREDRVGLAVVEGLARILSALVRGDQVS